VMELMLCSMLVWLFAGEEEADGGSDEVPELSSGMQVLGLRYPSPQVTSVMAPYYPNTMSASR
jgi:hypothetical protein